MGEMAVDPVLELACGRHVGRVEQADHLRLVGNGVHGIVEEELSLFAGELEYQCRFIRIARSPVFGLSKAEIGKIEFRQREVLLLFAIAELEYSEIASALGIPLGSVQSSLHRARTKIRAVLSPEVRP